MWREEDGTTNVQKFSDESTDVEHTGKPSRRWARSAREITKAVHQQALAGELGPPPGGPAQFTSQPTYFPPPRSPVRFDIIKGGSIRTEAERT